MKFKTDTTEAMIATETFVADCDHEVKAGETYYAIHHYGVYILDVCGACVSFDL